MTDLRVAIASAVARLSASVLSSALIVSCQVSHAVSSKIQPHVQVFSR